MLDDSMARKGLESSVSLHSLNSSQRLWILTANHVSGELSAAPATVEESVRALELVKSGGQPDTWVLTQPGWKIWRLLVANSGR